MKSLNTYNNQKLFKLDETSLKQAEKLINDIEQNIDFFHHRLKNQPKMTDVHTHMGLFESYLKELSSIVKYDTVLEEEFKERYNKIKEANTEIRRLNKLLGEEITPEGISSKLDTYLDAIKLWSGAIGFNFVSIEKCLTYGVECKFYGNELKYNQYTSGVNNKEWEKQFFSNFSLIAKEDSVYDICRDAYDAELLDTDKNKTLINGLFYDSFPNSKLYKFESIPNDFESFSINFYTIISYVDIDNMLKKLIENYH